MNEYYKRINRVIDYIEKNLDKEHKYHLDETDLSNVWRYSMDKEIAPEKVAYIRHIGPYAGDEALFGRLFGELCQWAGPRGLIDDDAVAEGDINIMEIPGGKYAVGHFEIDVNEYGDA